jgi:hypothetical protein
MYPFLSFMYNFVGMPPNLFNNTLVNNQKHQSTALSMSAKLLLCCFFFITIKASSQQFVERVYLKDSSFYEGYIIEQVPTQYLKIDRFKLKDTVTVPLSLVWKITKMYMQPAKLEAQKVVPKKNKERYLKVAYSELLGSGGLYSLNYDMRTEKAKRNGWGFRIGVERIPINSKDTLTGEELKLKSTIIPFNMNYLFGKKKGFFELGLGATYIFLRFNGRELTSQEVENLQTDFYKGNLATIFGTLNIGYRHVPYGKGIMYRFTFTPLLIATLIIPSIGISVGYKF